MSVLSLLDIIDKSPSINTPLIFNDSINTSNVKNLLLIDSIVSESQLFFDSSNTNTFPIIYSNNSNRDDFIKLLEDKFSNGLERIAFVFHDNIKDGKEFLNQELFFLESDIQENINSYSANTQLLIDVTKKYGIKNIDFLACNSLNYQNWIKFYDILSKETGVIVGASNDKTGNLKNGGDWLMENTNENVISTYFNSNIENYASTLAVTITQNGGIIYIQQSGSAIQYQSNSTSGSWTTFSSWPVTFINSNPVSGNVLTVSLFTNITISNTTVGTGTNGYFITSSSYITYDGAGKTVTIDTVNNYLGLIRNGTSGANGYSNVTVKNINSAISGSSVLAVSAGWICQGYFGKGVNNILVDNCTNSGAVNGDLSGGICGTNAGENGSCIVNNCYSTGTISGNDSGGICGIFAGNNNGLLLISNCYSTGTISGNYSAGGICGSYAGYTSGTVLISNCYSTGVISGDFCGGIIGSNFGYNSNNLCSIINCYNLGNINGGYSGGITGGSVGYNDNAIYIPQILIQNCYSLGNISTTSGGICGGGTLTYSNIPVVNITNCYTAYNSIVDANSQYISTNLPTAVRNAINKTNVYTSLISSWSDTSANASLTGVPTSLYSNNPGATWFSVANNTPYLLSIYNASLYSPATVNNTSAGSYVSSAGLFTSGYNYNLISVNNALPSADITINNTTGVLTFANLLTNTYIEKVLCYKGISPTYYGYNFNTFTLNQITPGITITQNGGIIYIQQSGNNIQYQLNSTSGTWTNINGWPVTIVNSNPVSGNILTVSLFTNITISNATVGTGINGYFITGSSYITYDGTGKTVTIDTVSNYPGLIQNGTSGANGFSNITVKNINNAILGSAVLAGNAGWICQEYFGKGVNNILIDNCSNSGQIGNNGSGGVCGGNTGRNNATVTITNCYNSGTITSNYSGGICGANPGYINGIVTIINCYSTGNITGSYSGGITGDAFGYNSNNLCSITNCYNTGDITGTNSGGITGAEVGLNNNAIYTPKILIQNCYSLGNIGTSCGGICGGTEGDVYTNIPVINITNCYTAYNSIVDPDSQYIATNLQTAVRNAINKTNVYTSLISSWSDSSANSSLTGVPTSLYSNNPGITWFSVATNTPYLLSIYNASLYSPATVNNTSAGSYVSSAGLFTSGYNYNLISVNNALPSADITINNTTGVLTFANLLTNTYIEKVLCYKGTSPAYYGYNFNTFTLNQTSPVPGITITQNGGIIYIQQSGSSIQYQLNSTSGTWTNISGWPVTIVNSNPVASNILTISLFTNIKISNTTVGTGTNGYFITNSEYITYDGSGKTVTIDTVTNYLGLIQNGTSTANGYSNVTVQNINSAISGSSGLAGSAGWICKSYFGKGVSNILISNCYSTGTISGSGSGGICGKYVAQNNGTVLINNCYSTGAINGNFAGGICGGNACQQNGKVTIINCYSTGVISGNYAGGITGNWFGYNTNNLCTIQNCYSLGNITGTNSSGIIGAEVGYNDSSYTPKILIQNCYSLGNISTTNGGICGGTEGDVYTNIPIVNITNCYTSYNSIVDSGSEYIATNLQTAVRNSIILTNVYSSLINSWSDTNANNSLSGSQSIFKNSILYKYYSNFGAFWYSNQNNTPFNLTSYLNTVPRKKKIENP